MAEIRNAHDVGSYRQLVWASHGCSSGSCCSHRIEDRLLIASRLRRPFTWLQQAMKPHAGVLRLALSLGASEHVSNLLHHLWIQRRREHLLLTVRANHHGGQDSHCAVMAARR